jgi:gamma-glutamyltranspeptidase / glutathione hydrolase
MSLLMPQSSDYPYPSKRTPVFAKNVVATSQPLAVQAGLSMLQDGGNAVDAALAAAITLTVVEPTGNGIGSDAFSIIWDGKTLHGFNGSGRSPKAWSTEYFAKYNAMPTLGWDTVTVPGAVNLWVTLSERFGRLPFHRLFKPAIDYAKNGFLVSPFIAAQWADAALLYRDFPDFRSCFLLGERPPGEGSVFKCPDLADTLLDIAETKGKSFYTGRLAAKIIDHSERTGGWFAVEDLAEHASEAVEPLSVPYRDIRIHEIPPNGQGIAALLTLGILNHFDLSRFAMDSIDSLHLQIEAMKIAFRQVFRHVADPRTMTMDPVSLLDPSFLSKLAEEISMDRARPFSPIPGSEGGTVYLTAADASGMMVSFIQSNYFGFGSGIVVPGTGISLQSRGLGFTLEPGHPNRVAGGKRPFHTIIPGFATKNRLPLMSFGVMGAHMQPQGHLQTMVRCIDYGLNPQAALDAPRWHVAHDFTLSFEDGFSTATLDELTRRGHHILKNTTRGLYGGGQIIRKLKEGYVAASDPRKDGHAAGF